MSDRRRIVAVSCRAGELGVRLAESIALLESGARFIDPAELPTELEINSCHAQLARLTREARRWRFP
jgi:hypothetical protein